MNERTAQETIKAIYDEKGIIKWTDIPKEYRESILKKERENVANDDYQFSSECILDDWKELLECLGFEDAEIQYTGFWSQGDGASFTCDRVDVEKLLNTALYDSTVYDARLWRLTLWAHFFGFTASVVRYNNFYSHENTVHVKLHDDEGILNGNDFAYLHDFLTSTLRILCSKIYLELETEYDYLQTEEYLLESFQNNETDFSWYFDFAGNFNG